MEKDKMRVATVWQFMIVMPLASNNRSPMVIWAVPIFLWNILQDIYVKMFSKIRNTVHGIFLRDILLLIKTFMSGIKQKGFSIQYF